MIEKISMEEHLCHVSTLTGQLANIGIAIPNDELVDRVLTSLPVSWDILGQMISSRERPPTYDELEGLLLLEDSIRSVHRECVNDEEAMINLQEFAMLASRWNPHERSTHNRGFFNPCGRGFSSPPRTRSTFRGGANNFGNDNSHFSSHSQTFGCSNFAPSQHRQYDTSSGACHLCGSPYHWADQYEIKHLRNKVKQLELGGRSSASTWKRQDSANIAETHTCRQPDISNDEALAEVLDIYAAEVKKSNGEDDWFIDSGASTHVTGNRNLLYEIRHAPHSTVSIATGKALPIVGEGVATLDNKSVDKIMYVPGMCKNLLLVGKFVDLGLYTLLGPKTCWIFKKDNLRAILLTGTREKSNSLYRLNTSLSGFTPSIQGLTANLAAATQQQQQTVELWHKRVGHLNNQSLYNLSKRNMVLGLPNLPLVRSTCEACVLSKHHRQPIPKVATAATSRTLELVHSDLCGPFPQPSLSGSRYLLTFIDDYSRRSWVYFLATKNETFESFKYWRQMVENESNLRFSCLCIDRRGEYLSTKFNTYYKQTGVWRQLTAARTPQQNGLAK
jgi:hypothetical protein